MSSRLSGRQTGRKDSSQRRRPRSSGELSGIEEKQKKEERISRVSLSVGIESARMLLPQKLGISSSCGTHVCQGNI